jgi:hypothetical protein
MNDAKNEPAPVVTDDTPPTFVCRRCGIDVYVCSGVGDTLTGLCLECLHIAPICPELAPSALPTWTREGRR